MQLNIHSQVGARFKLIVRKASDDSISRETEWFHNLVLDTGLNRMSVGTWIDRCCVGSGSSTPTATQVQLDNFIASTTTKNSSSNSRQTSSSTYYAALKITWRFGQGVAAGNISEVGLGWGNATLWNRALIKDANGNPTTITVLSDEYLDVVSEIRIYLASGSGSFNLLDKTGALISSHTYSLTPAMYYDPTIQTIKTLIDNYFYVYSGDSGTSPSSAPSGSMYYVSDSSWGTATNPSTTSVRRVLTAGLSQLNASHRTLVVTISILSNSNPFGYKVQINPPITKTSSQIMTYTFDLSWGRYTG